MADTAKTETTTPLPVAPDREFSPEELAAFARIEPLQEREFSATELFEISRRLEQHHAVFAMLMELGCPRFTTLVPTAAVCFDKQGHSIDTILVNPAFWDGQTTTQRDFIIGHECLHVLLSHGLRAKDAKNREACNVAMDVVVNEMLCSKFDFKRADVDPANQLCWRDKIFSGMQVAEDETFEYYYNRLKLLAEERQQQGQSGKGAGKGGSGSGANGANDPTEGEGEAQLGDVGQTLDDHSMMDGEGLPQEIADALAGKLSDEEKKQLEKGLGKEGKEAAKAEQDAAKGGSSANPHGKSQGGPAGGPAGLAGMLAVQGKVVKKHKWERIIKRWSQKFLPDAFVTREHWLRTNRRMSMIPDAALLPSEMEDTDAPEKGRILVYMFLDTSGSCAGLAERFWNAAASLPEERFDVRCYCFDTTVYEVDLKSRKLYGFGGTYFHILEEKIQAEIKQAKAGEKETKSGRKLSQRYPEAVFVITDGYGDNIKPERPENWYWFLAGSSTKSLIPDKSKTYDLKDFE